MTERTCSYEDEEGNRCSDPVLAKGLCSIHYYRQLRGKGGGGPVGRMRHRKAPNCRHPDGCPEKSQNHGWCSMHWERVQRTGDPGPVERLKGKRKPAHQCPVIDENGVQCPRMTKREFCALHYERRRRTGSVGPALSQARGRKKAGHELRDGYRGMKLNGRRTSEHRVVMAQKEGRELYPFETPHHKNGLRWDNRPENLELFTKPQPAGQRPEDLADWIVEYYPERVIPRLIDHHAEQVLGELKARGLIVT